MSGLELSLLGPFSATLDGQTLKGFRTRVAQALLEYETLSADEVRLVLEGGDPRAGRLAEKEREDRARRPGAKPAPGPTAEPGTDRPAAGAEPQGGFAY